MIDIERGTANSSKDREEQPKIFYSPKEMPAKTGKNSINSDDDNDEDGQLLNDDEDMPQHQSPIGRINRTTYSGSAIGAMIENSSSNSNSTGKNVVFKNQFSDQKNIRKKTFVIDD